MRRFLNEASLLEIKETQSLTWAEVPPESKKKLGVILKGKKISIFIKNFSKIVSEIIETNSASKILKEIRLLEYETLIFETLKKLITGVKKKVKNEIRPFYKLEKLEEVCEKQDVTIDFWPKGANLVNEKKGALGENRGFDNIIFFDVNHGKYDHKGPNSTATTEVIKEDVEVIKKEAKGKKLVTHEKSDLDSVVSLALYLMKLNGDIKGDESILTKFKNYTEAIDLGRWKELDFEKVDLSFIIKPLQSSNFSDLKIQKIMYEVINRIIKEDLDPTDLKGDDFRDIKIKKGKKYKNINIGDEIDKYEGKRIKNLNNFYKRSDVSKLPNEEYMVYIEHARLSKFEIYQLGFSVVFDGVTFSATQEWADKNRDVLRKTRDELGKHEQIARQQIVNLLEPYYSNKKESEIDEKFFLITEEEMELFSIEESQARFVKNTEEGSKFFAIKESALDFFLRKGPPRPGYENSNPWVLGETGCQLIQPSGKNRSLLQKADILKIVQDFLFNSEKEKQFKKSA